ncbi:hypothetical protein PR003_g12747 [Phytophthora rubi]|uniref:B9 domain-containing protein 2 n=1 Tax=Phytophthora rubi TaxID=129364 RepID=A0A6A4EZA6_9STRA|nr:hypothetical protein PR001_g11963 [Phytophthora rubi]KAE9335964.1 hypothetical protein PR003_g12747 [Phytophthora rubi]
MLKKLASPKKRAQPSGAGAGSFDAPDAAGTVAKSPKKKKEPKPKPPKEPKEKKNKTKQKEKTDTGPFGLGDATPAIATAAPVSDEAKETGIAAVATAEAKTPSPRKSIARAFRRKTLFDQDNAPEAKSPTKKPLASPKKALMKLPKPEKKTKPVTKKQEAKAPDEAIDPNAVATAATEKDPLTPSKPDAGESPKRKSRWKMPDMKPHKAPNNQKETIHDEEKAADSTTKPPLSPNSDNNASRENSPSPRVRGKRGSPDKRKLPTVESSSSGSEEENQTNVLSPLRRHKPDPDDTLPIPESPYNPSRVLKRLAQLDVPPAYQPEVHLIGEIVSGHGFGAIGGLTCKWRVEYGSRWSHIAGDQFGQTQLDYPSTAPWTSDPDVAVWAHPIDLHFATSAFQGWPKLMVQVWRADSSMKLHVVGYGFVPVPFAAGQHKLWISLWRPLGTTKEELDVHLLGRTPELKSDDVLFNAAWSERCRLRTVSTGRVLVHIGVLLRHFQAGVIEA